MNIFASNSLEAPEFRVGGCHHPGHARKYAARLGELGMPFLYYENTDGGHQATANLREAARRRTLEYTYLAQQLMD